MRKDPSSSDDEEEGEKYKRKGTRIMGFKGRKHPNKHHCFDNSASNIITEVVYLLLDPYSVDSPGYSASGQDLQQLWPRSLFRAENYLLGTPRILFMPRFPSKLTL